MADPFPSEKDIAKARLVLSIGMLTFGFDIATWASRLPVFQQNFQASPGMLSISLLCGATGSLMARQISVSLCSRFGSGPVAVCAAIVYSLLMSSMPFCPTYASFCICFFFLGSIGGILGVALNAHAIFAERLHGRPIMSRLHGFFSTGCMTGALLSSFVVSLGLPPALHFGGVAAVLIGTMLTFCSWVLPAGLEKEARPKQRPIAARDSLSSFATVVDRLKQHRMVLVFCAMTLCSYMSEGAIGDWTAIYMKTGLHTSEGLAALALAVFNVAMCVGRFSGDALTSSLGPAATVRLGGALAFAGLSLEILSIHPVMAMVGLAIAGLGFSNIVPNVISACGKTGDNAAQSVATVCIAGNVGSLLGPPIIGFTAEFFGLRSGLALTCLASISIAILASNLRGKSPAPAPEATVFMAKL